MKLQIEFDVMSTHPVVKEIVKEMELEVVKRDEMLISNEYYIETEDPFKWMLEHSEDERYFIIGLENYPIPVVQLSISDDYFLIKENL